jgi:hypothetical protein
LYFAQFSISHAFANALHYAGLVAILIGHSIQPPANIFLMPWR